MHAWHVREPVEGLRVTAGSDDIAHTSGSVSVTTAGEDEDDEAAAALEGEATEAAAARVGADCTAMIGDVAAVTDAEAAIGCGETTTDAGVAGDDDGAGEVTTVVAGWEAVTVARAGAGIAAVVFGAALLAAGGAALGAGGFTAAAGEGAAAAAGMVVAFVVVTPDPAAFRSAARKGLDRREATAGGGRVGAAGLEDTAAEDALVALAFGVPAAFFLSAARNGLDFKLLL